MKKLIVSTHETRDAASGAELELICKLWGDPRMKNRAKAGASPVLGKSIKAACADRLLYSEIWTLRPESRALWLTMRLKMWNNGFVFIVEPVLLAISRLSEREFSGAMEDLVSRDLVERTGNVFRLNLRGDLKFI